MNISKITQTVAPHVNKAASKIGKAINSDTPIAQKASKAFKLFEANGADNSFFGLATIMGCFVVIPRIKSALKRNPDNKEATMDEIKEILFRDLQTIAIILFGLKSMNTVIANISTKITKIPLVDVPYKKVFAKGDETILQRGKNLVSNIFATINPLGGSKCMNSAEINSLYASFPHKDSEGKLITRDSIVKLLNTTEVRGGKKESVFSKIRSSVIKSLDGKIKAQKETGQYINGVLSTQLNIDRLEETKDFFGNLTLEKFMDRNFKFNADYESELYDALSNEKTNLLAFGANVINSALKTLALGIEVGYLGFGLPKLNQKRLEKKYLSEKPIGEQRGDTFSPVNDRHIKAQEIKLYKSFMK